MYAATGVPLTWAQTHRAATASGNRARSAVRGLFGFAMCAWWLARDPSPVLRITFVPPEAVRPLAPSAEAAMLAAMAAEGTWEAHRDALLFRTALATGLRVGSLVSLDAADIEPELSRLVVRVKGGHTMAVTVAPDLAEALVELAATVGGPVFTTRSGRRMGVRQVQTLGGCARSCPGSTRTRCGTRSGCAPTPRAATSARCRWRWGTGG